MIGDGWKVILMVARLSRWKRHDMALSVFETVAQAIPEAHLFFVGAADTEDPEWFAYVQKMAAAGHYSHRIRWIGYADDVRPWYKAAYLSILPSNNAPFGRVFVDSMARGVPVVAFRCGGIPEIIEHEQDGLLV
jgi:glycosyltransferase involved in cell wall biosynthesis